MTENETIKMFEERLTLDTIESVPEYAEALRTAITSLKEIQMYHDGKLCLIPKDVYSRQCEQLDEYKEIGTVEECRKAVEKQTAKKIENWNGQASCPNCKVLYGNMKDIKKLISYKFDYCKDCGQAIQWEDENLEGMEE